MFDSMYAEWAGALAPWIPIAVVLAIVFTPAGIGLIAWSGRRRFGRRNFAGIEEFSSYSHAVGSRLIEGFVDRVGVLALATGLLAGFFAAYAVFLQRYR
jgi:hypothetical protein